MKSGIFITRFFVAGLTLSLLIFSPFILDFTLLPRFICLTILAGAMLWFFFRSGNSYRFRPDVISCAYLLYGLFCCLSVGWSINKAESLFAAEKVILAIIVFLLTYAVMKLQKEHFTGLLLRASIFIFFILIAVATSQFTMLSDNSKDALYGVTSLNSHKNLFASFLLLNLFFLFSAFYKFTNDWKAVSWIAIVLTFVALLIIRTKAVWAGGFVFLIIFTACSFLNFKSGGKTYSFYLKLVICLIAANMFFLCLLEPAIEKTLVHHPESGAGSAFFDEERLMLWDKTYDMFHKDALAGVGVGNWQIHFPDATLSGIWRAEDLNYTFQRPHNDFLWILSETGIIGLNLFFIFIFSLIIYLIKALKAGDAAPETKKNIILCIAIIFASQVVSFFDFPMERIEHIILLNIIFGISYFHVKSTVPVLALAPVKISKPMFALFAGLLFFVFLTGVLRYRGEYFTRKMLDFKNTKQNALLIQAANSALSFAYQVDPTSVPIHWYSGNAKAMNPGHNAEVFEDLQKAYYQNPYNRNVLNDLASAFALDGNLRMAKMYYTEAARISPRFDEPKLNLIAIYINERNYGTADSCIKTLFHNSERRSQYQKIIDALREP